MEAFTASLWQGLGVVCERPGGIPKDTFVGEYMGELYTPWAWFEKLSQGGGKGGSFGKKSRTRMGLPDFYNITLERPKQDSLGYDIMFVEARCSLPPSRLSCHPPQCVHMPGLHIGWQPGARNAMHKVAAC